MAHDLGNQLSVAVLADEHRQAFAAQAQRKHQVFVPEQIDRMPRTARVDGISQRIFVDDAIIERGR